MLQVNSISSGLTTALRAPLPVSAALGLGSLLEVESHCSSREKVLLPHPPHLGTEPVLLTGLYVAFSANPWLYLSSANLELVIHVGCTMV